MNQSYTNCLSVSPKTSTYLKTLYSEEVFDLIELNVENCLLKNKKINLSKKNELKNVLIMLDYLGHVKDLEVVPPKVIPKKCLNHNSNSTNHPDLNNNMLTLVSAMIHRFIEHSEKAIFDAAIESLSKKKLMPNQTQISSRLCLNHLNDLAEITVLSISKQISELSNVLAQMIYEECFQHLRTTTLSPQELELLVNLLLNEIYNES